MSKTRKILLGIGGGYVLLIVLAVAFTGWSRNDNTEFLPQNEFKLDNWVRPRRRSSINKAVLYLFIAGVPDDLDDGLRRAPDAGPAEPRPDRGRGRSTR